MDINSSPSNIVESVIMQSFMREIDTMSRDMLSRESTTYTTGSASTLTMNDILEAKRKLESIQNVQHVPRLLEMPFPKMRARIHRKKRIDKKWLKRYGFVANASVDKGTCYVFNDFSGYKVVAAYPKTFSRINKALQDFQ